MKDPKFPYSAPTPRLADKPLVLYGYGKLGRLAEEIFNQLGIKIYGVIEKGDLPRKSEYKQSCLVAVCVATEPYYLIKESLILNGWTDIAPVWDILDAYADITGIHNGWFTGRVTRYELLKIKKIYETFADETSRKHYWAQYLWRTMRVEKVVEVAPMPTASHTLPSTLADIQKRYGVDVYADAPMDMDNVRIHNEGCELKTLKVNMPLFQKYRPNISCACYHSRDGLWKIQKVLMENLPNYRWRFRLHGFQGQGAYIYGIPASLEERGK